MYSLSSKVSLYPWISGSAGSHVSRFWFNKLRKDKVTLTNELDKCNARTISLSHCACSKESIWPFYDLGDISTRPQEYVLQVILLSISMKVEKYNIKSKKKASKVKIGFMKKSESILITKWWKKFLSQKIITYIFTLIEQGCWRVGFSRVSTCRSTSLDVFA